MADSTDMSSSRKRKRGRGVTMMRKLLKVRQTGKRINIQFNQTTWTCSGAEAKTFRSCLAFLARSSCSILKDEWKNIEQDVKNKLWSDLQTYFIIPVIHPDPAKDPLRKVWMQYAGDRWRGFKTQLTREYVTDPKEDRDPPYVRYNYIDEKIWKKFLASRDTPEFKEKSQKGKEKVAKNCHPHRLSRGGYEFLTEKMMTEKKLLKDSGDDRSPSPPPRHEKWMRARQTKEGEYTSKATATVAEKIDSLVEEAKKGTFFPIGRDDILSNAIGKPEHGGTVRGVGRGATISNYFGRSSCSTSNMYATKQLSELETKLRADFEKKMVNERQLMKDELKQEMKDELKQEMMQTLKSIGYSEATSPKKQVVEECPPKDIVNGSVKASCSAAPANIKEDSDCVTNFKMSPKYMKDLLVGDRWLDFSILQLWCTYMHRLSIEAKKSDLYAFLDPCQFNFAAKPNTIQRAGKQYIQNKLRDLNKECYLVPYLWSGHWQLIIMCSKENIIVCLCSLHKKINEAMKNVVTDAFVVHQLACGNKRKPTWIFPKTRLQPNGNDCGYYVMKNMVDIVSASITNGWIEVFNDPTTLTEEELYDLRNRWASCFLDLYNPEVDYVDSVGD